MKARAAVAVRLPRHPPYALSVEGLQSLWDELCRKLEEGPDGYPYPSDTADPTGVDAGYTYYNTTTNKVRTWDGTAWQNHW